MSCCPPDDAMQSSTHSSQIKDLRAGDELPDDMLTLSTDEQCRMDPLPPWATLLMGISLHCIGPCAAMDMYQRHASAISGQAN